MPMRRYMTLIVMGLGLSLMMGCRGAQGTSTSDPARTVAALETVGSRPIRTATNETTARAVMTTDATTIAAAESTSKTTMALTNTTAPDATAVLTSTATISGATELETAEDYVQRGSVKQKAKDYDGAIADYTRAIELKSSVPGGYMNRSTVYRIKQEYAKALIDLEKEIVLRPTNYLAHYYRGTCLQIQKDFRNAIVSFDNALTIKDNLIPGYISRAESKAGLQEYDAAFADYDKAIALDTTNAAPLLSRGAVYANRNAEGDKDKAIADFRRVLEIAKTDAQKQRALSQLKKLGVE